MASHTRNKWLSYAQAHYNQAEMIYDYSWYVHLQLLANNRSSINNNSNHNVEHLEGIHMRPYTFVMGEGGS